jgi:hypothetical protein
MSAVEWFNDEIFIHLNFDQRLYLKDIYNQAKEMQKKQMMDFALEYMMQSKPVVDYYNETYGGNK